MLPPPEVLQHMKSKEEPAAYPSGPNTSFHNLTPMPHRFTVGALDQINKRHTEEKVVHPCYHTTSKEIGALNYSSSDLPMRWYGRTGNFTGGWVAEPKTKVNSGLNTGMDRSDVHQKCVPPLKKPSPSPHVVAARSRDGCCWNCEPRRSLLLLPSCACAASTRAGRATWVSPTTTWPTWSQPNSSARRHGGRTADLWRGRASWFTAAFEGVGLKPTPRRARMRFRAECGGEMGETHVELRERVSQDPRTSQRRDARVDEEKRVYRRSSYERGGNLV